MKIKFTLFISFTLLFLYGQPNRLKAADRKYEANAFIDAAKIYESVAEKGYKSVDLYQKIGNAYYFNGDLKNAVKWYRHLFSLHQEVEAVYYFRYANALKSQEQYDESNQYMAMFYEKNIATKENLALLNKDYLSDIEAVSGLHQIEKTYFNSEFYDYGPSFYEDKIVFTSSRSDANSHAKIHQWTNQNFTDLFVVAKDTNGLLNQVSNFSNEINTKYNESSPVFTKDGKTMYFTRNNYNNGKERKSSDKVSILEKIYSAQLVDGKWTNCKELPFCSDDYSTAHPALSPDEKTLFFASNRPGSLGMSDLYKVQIDEKGNFGTPENLGAVINTPGRETFPFVAENNTLYFASDGHLGLGGLDVFETRMVENAFGIPKNIGKPINSSSDDFGYVLKNDVGFFTSNREGGLGFDDIYRFKICYKPLIGTIVDHKNKKAIPNAKITLFDEDMNVVNVLFSSPSGGYELKLKCGSKYILRVSKENYETEEQIFIANNAPEKIHLELKQNTYEIKEGTDLAKVFDISLIYFDLDKWNIRSDAAEDLEKIIAVLKAYPNMKIEIKSHTDSRQTHQYNEILSDKRAKATLEFMVEKGIARDRLHAKGYGENHLINNCSDGIICSEEEHQKNRRSEFIVVKM